MTPILLGLMLNDVEQLGSTLSLEKYQFVVITPATNVPPSSGAWFTRPFGCVWPDKYRREEDVSIVVDKADVIPITDAQMETFKGVVERQGKDKLMSVTPELGFNALMVKFEHITIGIELSGYPHS